MDGGGILEPVRRHSVAKKGGIGEIGGGLGRCAKGGRRRYPTHREGEGNRHELRLVVVAGHEDSKLGRIIRVQEQAIEPVSDIKLGQVNRSQVRVRVPEQPQDAGEGAAELHDLGGKFRYSVFIDPRPSVVNKHSWPALLTFVLDCQR
jgi:hypothetical protein